MDKLSSFYNSGFGWFCIQCERELAGASKEDPEAPSRIFREGEAEKSAAGELAVARWTDKTRRFLTCPRCGITEAVEKA
jgi:hypothetical protein